MELANQVRQYFLKTFRLLCVLCDSVLIRFRFPDPVHLPPRLNRTTWIVSRMIIRSKEREMFLM